MDRLSVRKLQIIELYGNGFTLKEVARKLGISRSTVKNTLLVCRRIMHAQNCTHLACLCAQAGYIVIQPNEGNE